MSRPTLDLGTFSVGEVPLPLVYQFLDTADEPLDLTDFDVVTFQWSEVIQGQFISPVIGIGTVTDAANGIVTYVWNGDEFTRPGEFAALFFVNDGTNQYASTLITWHVCVSVGEPPGV